MPVASTFYVPMPQAQDGGYHYSAVVPDTAVTTTPLLVNVAAAPAPAPASPSPARRGLPACLLLLLALVFAVVVITTSSLLRNKAVDPKSAAVLTIDYGPFRFCYNTGQNVPGIESVDRCTTLDNRCHFKLLLADGLSIKVPAVDDCSRWDTARGLLVASIVGLGAAFLMQLLALSMKDVYRSPHVLIALGTLVGWVGGLVAMALFHYERHHDAVFQPSDNPTDPRTTIAWGYGIYLLGASWILAFLAFLATCHSVRVGRSMPTARRR